MGKINTQVMLDETTKQRLDTLAEASGMTISGLIRKILLEWLLER
jgi:predicted DNA-binding protein